MMSPTTSQFRKSVFHNLVQKYQLYKFCLLIYYLQLQDTRTHLYVKCLPRQEIEGIQNKL